MISGGWPPDCKAGGCGYREKKLGRQGCNVCHHICKGLNLHVALIRIVPSPLGIKLAPEDVTDLTVTILNSCAFDRGSVGEI